MKKYLIFTLSTLTCLGAMALDTDKDLDVAIAAQSAASKVATKASRATTKPKVKKANLVQAKKETKPKAEKLVAPKAKAQRKVKSDLDNVEDDMSNDWKSLKEKAKNAKSVAESTIEGWWKDISGKANDWSSDISGWLKDVDVAQKNISSHKANVELAKKVTDQTSKNINGLQDSDHPMVNKTKKASKNAQKALLVATQPIEDAAAELKNCIKNCRDKAMILEKEVAKNKTTSTKASANFVSMAQRIVKELNSITIS